MNKYNKWLNSKGSIMYYYVFDFVDMKGAAVAADVHLRLEDSPAYSKGVSQYEIRGNFSISYMVGEDSESNEIVTDEKTLSRLNALPFKYDAIKFLFEDKAYM